jgi:hypothetical protein
LRRRWNAVSATYVESRGSYVKEADAVSSSGYTALDIMPVCELENLLKTRLYEHGMKAA